MGSQAIAAAYTDLLARERWQWFCTLTFNGEHRLSTGGMLPEKADKAFRWFIRCINEKLYSKRWMDSKHGGVLWARGTESHANGRPHFHAVLAAPNLDLNASASRYEFHELWYREFGRNQIERPRNQDEVARYVSKYVAKEGEIDFSHNYGRYNPPPLPWVELESGASASRPLLRESCIGGLGGKRERDAKPASLSLTLPVCLKFAAPGFAPPTDLDLGNQDDEKASEM